MTVLRRSLVISAVLAAVFSGVSAGVFTAAAGESASESPWTDSANARARLLAAGPRAGLEIALAPDAHTYWRDPGDAGVPPKMTFSGSRNLKRAELRFPTPERIDEGGLQVIGYRASVILPIDVEPENPAEPVHLSVQFAYAACAKICTPAEAEASLDLQPGPPTGPHAPRLAAAAASLPLRLGAGEAPAIDLAAAPTGDGKRRWTLRSPEAWRDLFVEGPENWFFETERTPGGFSIVAAQAPSGASGAPPVRLTLAGPRAVEIDARLP